MEKLYNLNPNRVFYYFEAISAIPRGSGDQKAISDYCMEFAKTHALKALHDDANNVIIFKSGTKGYEDAEPVILQGHLDMVCQKTEGSAVDFTKDGIDLYIDGDYIKAKETTLGADNGIAIAMIFAILESEEIPHPPIEAVFTTDEEIGMIGAKKLCFDWLKGKKMINLDSEDPKTITVSCAGGSDLRISLPIVRKKIEGTRVILNLQGLKGGHSGVEINAGRVNADMLAGRVLHEAKKAGEYQILRIDGGDKGNAIPRFCKIQLVVQDVHGFTEKIAQTLTTLKKELADREDGFTATVEVLEQGEFSVMDEKSGETLQFILLHAPNGVIEMSASVENLVETSLNLGILETKEETVNLLFSLRSNQESALKFLADKLLHFARSMGCEAEVFGYYPPWEYNKDSYMQTLCQEVYQEIYGEKPVITAIHAGLECAVFASQISGLDCISIGPKMLDIHTTDERLSISSTNATYRIVLEVLKRCK